MKKLLVLIIVVLILAACVPSRRFEKFTVAQAQAALVASGVEFVDPKPITKDDYGLAPMSAKEGVHFLIPSLCPDCGGRIFSFSTPEDLALMQNYYVNAGKQSAMFFSWVFVKDNILVQINGDLPEEKAKPYDAALQNMK